MIKHLTDEDFSNELKNSPKAVVDFHASWCGPCKMFGPTFEKVSKEVEGVAFYKVDVDSAEKTAQEFNVMSVPTTIFFENGEEKDRSTGALNEETLKKEISEKLS